MNALSEVRLHGPRKPRLRFQRRFDKIIELLVRMAEIKPNRDQYQAVKLFYLSDKEHFNRYGRPITFEIYYALDYGPVASTALDLIKGNSHTLREAGISRLPISIQRLDKLYLLRKAERAVDLDVFSKSDLKVFDEIVAEYGDRSFDDLYQITHRHAAYRNAWDHKPSNDRRALIFYEDMLDDSPNKEEIIEDLEPISLALR